ncbi:MAG TPA: MarR family transcriptional regulator [Cellulomonas sp.]
MTDDRGTTLDTAYPDPTKSPGLALWHVTNSWQRAVREALQPFELTHVQYVLLAALTWSGASGPTTQRDLADVAGTDVMMTSQVVRALAAKGLVVRGQHPTDRRAFDLQVTTAGATLASAATVAVEAADRDYFAPLRARSADFIGHLTALHEAHPR